MASARNTTVVFHFEKAHSPKKVLHVIRVLQNEGGCIADSPTWEQIACEQSNAETRFDEARSLAQELSLVEKTKEGFQLTSVAALLLTKRDTIQYDLLHALFYSAWDPEKPAKFGRAWFYRSFCHILWNNQYTKLDATTRVTLAEQLTQEARIAFQSVPGFIAEKTSVSTKTMDGAQEWLTCLQPPAMRTKEKHVFEFGPRQTCSAELFLFALSRIYQLNSAEVGIDVLLSVQKRNEICECCLLNPLQFDRMLDWTLSQLPQHISAGTRSGSYGRFVRLRHYVQIADILQGVVVS